MDFESEEIRRKTNTTYLGLSGGIWCLLAGICYGALNVSAKLAFESGVSIAHFFLFRGLSQTVFSYLLGKHYRGTNFSFNEINNEARFVLLTRSSVNAISKVIQLLAISFIPLALSSTISFTTGPLFAAMVAFIVLQEHLTTIEMLTVSLGVLGTVILTMPEWFKFLGLDDDELVEARYDADMEKYSNLYFVGIVLALGSSFFDVNTMYIIRHMQDKIPKPMYSFSSGLFNSIVLTAYCLIFKQWTIETSGWQYILVGSFFGWIALEFNINGTMVSKSALASYAEQFGIVIPFAVDVFYFERPLLHIDVLGLLLIVALQGYQAVASSAAQQSESSEHDVTPQYLPRQWNEQMSEQQRGEPLYSPPKNGIFPSAYGATEEKYELPKSRCIELFSEEKKDDSFAGEDRQPRITAWDGTKYFSDLVKSGLDYLKDPSQCVMIHECPSTASADTSFRNVNLFKVHDYPFQPIDTKIMRPLRYSALNGDTFPSYHPVPPNPSIVDHWEKAIPNFIRPAFTNEVPSTPTKVYVYMPMEGDFHFINDPHFLYHLSGKDAIPCMTTRTTKLLPNTKDVRPCVAKVTHAFANLGIFVIHNDDDEKEFLDFLQENDDPAYVVTEFVDIKRNLACHFFVHPNGDILWFGSSENLPLPGGNWDSDSSFSSNEQGKLQDMMASYAKDVAEYFLANDFWGFVGIDVLFDGAGNGYTVDVNPRVTGTMPALMVAKHMDATYGLTKGKFRSNLKKWGFAGSSEQLFQSVDKFNDENVGVGRIVIFSVFEKDSNCTKMNLAVYGKTSESCDGLLHLFCEATHDDGWDDL